MSHGNPAAVAIARQWIGTPYLHQASCLGAGADCLGLVRGIWRGLNGEEPAAVPPYTPDWSEPRRQERLWHAARLHLVERPLGALLPGDVVLFRMRDGGVAKHLGVISQAGARAAFIHAYTGHGVIESPLSAPWQRRIVARFEFPDRRL
ncbi:NlpC/P60 family protein [Oceaniglobus trochenteri]|uniref:NlpC/P60 family protein n=1 Tax=Oceaniglobus trochenteri TaxID=2763260 RepID=UPI001CFF5E61|nr:NlpC/P60 family protein [Oceaniglobus trochenteri]